MLFVLLWKSKVKFGTACVVDCPDFAAVGENDCFTDGKPDSHAFSSIRRSAGRGRRAVKDGCQLLRRDADAVITHMKNRIVGKRFHIALDRFGAFRVDNGIFQQVDENLFDENCVHRDHQEFLRHAHMDIGVWKSLF